MLGKTKRRKVPTALMMINTEEYETIGINEEEQ